MIVLALNMIGTSAIGFLAVITHFLAKLIMSWNMVRNSFLLWYFFSVRDTLS